MEDWRREYNEVRPHSSIGDKPPTALINRNDEPARHRDEAGKIYFPVRANWGAVQSKAGLSS